MSSGPLYIIIMIIIIIIIIIIITTTTIVTFLFHTSSKFLTLWEEHRLKVSEKGGLKMYEPNTVT